MAALLQLAIIGVWGAILVIHTRRLLHLAQVRVPERGRDPHMRQRLERVWWWLGREEFWRSTQDDIFACIQLTLMILLFGLQIG